MAATVTVSRGIRNMPPRKKCRKGLHAFTPLNRAPDGRCIACLENRRHKMLRAKHKPQPTETGVCTKGLHPWVEENWQVAPDGTTRCRQCRRASAIKSYHRRHVPKPRKGRAIYKAIKCWVRECWSRTERKSGGVYRCPRHRST